MKNLMSVCRRIFHKRLFNAKENIFDETADERVTNDPKEEYRLDVFLPIIDRLTGEITTRFNERNWELYAEISYLNPVNFHKLTDTDSFSMRCLHCAKCHKHLAKSSVGLTGTDNCESEEDEAFDPDEDLRVCKGNCSSCMGCILTLLSGYRFQCRSYKKLYKCFRTALTLPGTVVSCERALLKTQICEV